MEYNFKSTLFQIKAGEDGATNQGFYGEELSEWLGQKLSQYYFLMGQGPEDWGWYVEVKDDLFCYMIGCVNDDLRALYYSEKVPLGEDVTWRVVFLKAKPKNIRIWFKQLFNKSDKKLRKEIFLFRLTTILKEESQIYSLTLLEG